MQDSQLNVECVKASVKNDTDLKDSVSLTEAWMIISLTAA